ncbi:HAD family hydrolase [Lactiplantibacillus paraxiangfangensis]|uniref:HAD family hydrolase n=1 Tax=Lactiplantibacillus paraxiangfangensis TaxID=3076224 RepID=UPI0030C684A9
MFQVSRIVTRLFCVHVIRGTVYTNMDNRRKTVVDLLGKKKALADYLICLDIDGTLVGADLVVSSRNRQALKMVLDAGAHVYLVSGRMWYAANVIAEDIDPRIGVVASNGAVIDTDGDIEMHGLSNQVVFKLVELSYRLNFSLFLFGQRQVYYTLTKPEYLSGDGFQRVHSPNLADYHQLTPLDHALDRPVANGIVVDTQHPERLPMLRHQLYNNLGSMLKLSTSNVTNIELIPNWVSKGGAIAQLQELTGVDAQHTVAIGDGENDLSMFAGIKYSVAMGNAAYCVQRAANYQTLDYRHDGVAAFLERELLTMKV